MAGFSRSAIDQTGRGLPATEGLPWVGVMERPWAFQTSEAVSVFSSRFGLAAIAAAAKPSMRRMERKNRFIFVRD